MRDERPNIILIVADDHRFESIGAFGNAVVETPALDALAARGTSFTKAYAMGSPQMQAVCAPSRACLLTGTQVFSAALPQEINDEGSTSLNPDFPTLPEVFAEAGYTTFGVGKWHNGRTSFARSFRGGGSIFFGGMSDHWQVPLHDFDPTGTYPEHKAYSSEKFSTEQFCDEAVGFVRQEHDRPYLLYLALTAPHDPRTAPEAYSVRYDPETVDVPENFLPEHPFDNGELRSRDELLAAVPRGRDEVRKHIADYYAMVEHTDAQVGRVFRALEEAEQLERSIIIYTADHGVALGQHGLMGKQNLYEHTVHIPLILSGSGIPASGRSEALVHLHDLFPTLCDLTGMVPPETLDGKSLVPLIRGQTSQVREFSFAAYKDVQRMVSDGRWKLIRYYHSDRRSVGTDHVQLFDLLADPWEQHNLSSDERCGSHLRRLTDELNRWQRETGPTGRL